MHAMIWGRMKYFKLGKAEFLLLIFSLILVLWFLIKGLGLDGIVVTALKALGRL